MPLSDQQKEVTNLVAIDITPEVISSYPCWQVLDVSYAKPAGVLQVTTLNEFGNPLGDVWVWVIANTQNKETDGEESGQYTDKNGMMSDTLLPNIIHSVYIKEYDATTNLPIFTQTVKGLVIESGYQITFQRLTAPINSLEDAVRQAAQSVRWMPIFEDAALYKFAQVNHLGEIQTDEVHFKFNGLEYVCQVANRGIMYALKNKWDNIKFIAK